MGGLVAGLALWSGAHWFRRLFPEARARLGAIIHPEVGARMARRIAAAREAGAEVVVLDIPLLFEGRKAGTGSAAQLGFDATVLVYAPEALQIERQM